MPGLLPRENIINFDFLVAQDQVFDADSVTGTSASSDDTSMIPLETYLKVLADKDAMEDAIRREADPSGLVSRSATDTPGLVKNLKKWC